MLFLPPVPMSPFLISSFPGPSPNWERGPCQTYLHLFRGKKEQISSWNIILFFEKSTLPMAGLWTPKSSCVRHWHLPKIHDKLTCTLRLWESRCRRAFHLSTAPASARSREWASAGLRPEVALFDGKLLPVGVYSVQTWPFTRSGVKLQMRLKRLNRNGIYVTIYARVVLWCIRHSC